MYSLLIGGKVLNDGYSKVKKAGSPLKLSGPLAIQKVREHVKKQADGYNPCFPKKQHYNIHRHRPIGMQRMKIDAATPGIEDWGGQKMVQIH